jgi:hypothetical protein
MMWGKGKRERREASWERGAGVGFGRGVCRW